MDDKRFDDLIKGKIGDYSDPEFEPSALASFHQKMAMAVKPSWYSRFRTEVLASSAVLVCAALVYWNQSQITDTSKTLLDEQAQLMGGYQNQIELLTNEIRDMKGAVPDTVYLVEYIPSSNNDNTLLLLSRIQQLEDELMKLQMTLSYQAVGIDSNPENGKPSDIQGTYSFLSQPEALFGNNRLNTRSPELSRATWRGNLPEGYSEEEEKIPFSAKTFNELEKHYMRGVGIKVAPVARVDKAFYSEGSGNFHLGGGLAVDFILSPHISLETGALYSMHSNKVRDASNSDLHLPGVDPLLGQLQTAEVDYYTVEIPVYVKYRYPLSEKGQVYVGLGYSPFLYHKQDFDYDYELSGNSNASVNTVVTNKDVKFYPGTVNLSLGLTNELKNKKILETGIYYQHGITGMGVEDVKIKMLGIKGAYWFTIR